MPHFSDAEVQQALGQLSGWQRSGNAIQRVFEFPSFLPGIEFVNQVARAAEQANHHPDITINYNKVTMSLTSHDSGGITGRDINLARTISELASRSAEKAA